MTTTAVNEIVPVERNWKTWLFNPFLFVAGFKALIIGLAFIIIASLLGFLGNIHFDGVLDLHGYRAAPAWVFIVECLIDWLSLSLILAVFAAIMWRKTSRFIDILGTQALARWPSVFSVLLMQSGPQKRVIDYFGTKPGGAPVTVNPIDMAVFIVTGVIIVFTIILMVALMYRAFAVSCNAKGTKAVVTFIISLLLGELGAILLIKIIPCYGAWW